MKKVFRRTSLLLAAILMGSTSIQAQKSPQDMDRFIDALMKKMTVEEKNRAAEPASHRRNHYWPSKEQRRGQED